jgi:hypothetical protein
MTAWKRCSVRLSLQLFVGHLDMVSDQVLSDAKESVSILRKNIFDIYVTEYGTALTTILPILFLYLNTVHFYGNLSCLPTFVLLYVFTFLVPYCDLRYDFRIRLQYQ